MTSSRNLLGPGYPGQNWPNPPTALVVMAPFGLLAYFPALFAWFAVSGLAFYLAGRREVADWRTLVIVLVSPAALLCVLSGPELAADDRGAARDLRLSRQAADSRPAC